MNRIYLTPAVKQITIACVVLFIGTKLLLMRGVFDLNTVLAMHYPMNPAFRPWQIITHMFMHDSRGISPHLIFNMIALVSIGPTVENILGTKNFVKLFFFSGLGSIGLHILVETIQVYNAVGAWFPPFDILYTMVNPDGTFNVPEATVKTVYGAYVSPLLGASGAIYGIVVAFAYYFPNTELMFMFIPYPIKAKYLIPIIILLDIYLGISNFGWDPIAHFAHIGGALTGLGIAWFWRHNNNRRFY